MRVTSKGQVTIPIAIRHRAGLLPGAEVTFTVRGDTVILRRQKSPGRRGAGLVATLRGTARRGFTTDQIMALTRGG
jgi:AbrB family looped-hinge helix DNA binding protein